MIPYAYRWAAGTLLLYVSGGLIMLALWELAEYLLPNFVRRALDRVRRLLER